MDDIKIITEEGKDLVVKSLFFSLNNTYYLIYTNRTLDQNGYVESSVVKLGRQIINGNNEFIGVEIVDETEWKEVQKIISKIVEDKKNNTQSTDFQYLPVSMLTTPVIIQGKKTFRLKKEIMENYFKININDNEENFDNLIPTENETDEIIDYRTANNEAQGKIVELNSKVLELTEEQTALKQELESLKEENAQLREKIMGIQDLAQLNDSNRITRKIA